MAFSDIQGGLSSCFSFRFGTATGPQGVRVDKVGQVVREGRHPGFGQAGFMGGPCFGVRFQQGQQGGPVFSDQGQQLGRRFTGTR